MASDGERLRWNIDVKARGGTLTLLCAGGCGWYVGSAPRTCQKAYCGECSDRLKLKDDDYPETLTDLMRIEEA